MKPLPTLSGTQYPGDIPWGMNVATNRGFGVAAVCAEASPPAPSRPATARQAPPGAAQEGPPNNVLLRDEHGFLFRGSANGRLPRDLRALDVVLEWRALDDAQHER